MSLALERSIVRLSDDLLACMAGGDKLDQLAGQWDLAAQQCEDDIAKGTLTSHAASIAYCAATKIQCVGESLVELAHQGDVAITQLVDFIDGLQIGSRSPTVSTHDPRSLPLRRWFSTHLAFPYPSPAEKLAIAAECKITKSKLDGDLTNWRRRSGWTDMMMTFAGGEREVMREMIDQLESGEEDDGEGLPDGLQTAVDGVRRYLAGEGAKVETSWIDELPGIADIDPIDIPAYKSAKARRARTKRAARVPSSRKRPSRRRAAAAAASPVTSEDDSDSDNAESEREQELPFTRSELALPVTPQRPLAPPACVTPPRRLSIPAVPLLPSPPQLPTRKHQRPDVDHDQLHQRPYVEAHRPVTRQRMNHIPSISSISSATTLIGSQTKRTVSGSSGYSTSTTTSTLVDFDSHQDKAAHGKIQYGADTPFTFAPSYASAYGLAPAPPGLPNMRKRHAEEGLTPTQVKHSRLTQSAARPIATPATVPVDPALAPLPFSEAWAAYSAPLHAEPEPVGPYHSRSPTASPGTESSVTATPGSATDVENYMYPQYTYAQYPYPSSQARSQLQEYAYPPPHPPVPMSLGIAVPDASDQLGSWVFVPDGRSHAYPQLHSQSLPYGHAPVPIDPHPHSQPQAHPDHWSTSLPLPQLRPEWSSPGSFVMPVHYEFAPRYEGWTGHA